MISLDDLGRAVRNIADYPKPGIQFKDITPLLGRADLLVAAVEHLAAPYREAGVTKVVGVEARGFILGGLLARELGAGFVPVRKRGKLPHRTLVEEYALEYGSDSVEMHVDALAPDDRVLIHDDVIATGGTSLAAYRLIRQAGATPVGFAFLIELGFLQGRQALNSALPVHALLRY